MNRLNLNESENKFKVNIKSVGGGDLSIKVYLNVSCEVLAPVTYWLNKLMIEVLLI